MTKRASDSWGAVKRRLAELSPAETVELLRDLYRLSAANREFVHARLSVGSPLTGFVEQVERLMYPDPLRNQPIRLAETRRVIAAYTKASSDPRGTLELRILAVECGTSFAADFGGMDDRLAAGLERLFEEAVVGVSGLPVEEGRTLFERLEQVVKRGEAIGWGYGDFLRECLHGARSAAIRNESAASPGGRTKPPR